MPTRDEIYTKVRGVLVEALGVDEEEVTPDATLSGDLGAESIDYLDISFRVEKEFAIKIPKGELFPDNIQDLLKDWPGAILRYVMLKTHYRSHAG